MKGAHGDAEHKKRGGGGAYVITMLFSLAALAIGCFAAFTVFIKGPEEVMVPDVEGMSLEDALMLMQEKELYARLTLRHSTAQDKGLVLEQDPVAGSIRKGYSRVSLVVSSGPIMDKMANYVGMTIDEVRLSVAAQFAGMAEPLIVIGQPMYKEDDSPIGTVLEQEPEALSPITGSVTLRLVVSRGNGRETVSVPDMASFTLEAMLKAISSLPLCFDYVAESANEGEAAHVVSVEKANETVDMWSRVKITLAIPTERTPQKVYGLFETDIEHYPKPVDMRLVATMPLDAESAQIEGAETAESERKETEIASFKHIGGHVAVPFCVAEGTELSLYAADTLCAKDTVE